jgi:hypothetical protein
MVGWRPKAVAFLDRSSFREISGTTTIVTWLVARLALKRNSVVLPAAVGSTKKR